jgi:5-formyltetrahydrofolate cyclo-ligase
VNVRSCVPYHRIQITTARPGAACAGEIVTPFTMTVPLDSSKTSLRQQVRARLRAMSPEQHRADSQQLCDRLFTLPVWKQARIVLLFAPLQNEPDIWPVISAALKEGKEVSLPKLDSTGFGYDACPINSLDDLSPGKFGILEPRDTTTVMALNRLDLLLVPGIAFDPRGGRLGRGKGFYDRLLAAVSGLKCGVAFDEQIVDTVPVGPMDVRLNCILTPTRWIET